MAADPSSQDKRTDRAHARRAPRLLSLSRYERVDARGPCEEYALIVGDDRRVLPDVALVPDQLPRPRVERESAARAVLDVPLRMRGPQADRRREVDEPRHDRRSPVNGTRHVLLPYDVARGCVERGEPPVVRADVHATLPDRGGCVDVAPDGPGPKQMAASGAECVHGAVRVRGVDATVRRCRRRIELLPPAEARERASAPPEGAAPGVDGEQMAPVAPEVHCPVPEGA